MQLLSDLKAYYSQINKAIICKTGIKKKFMSEFKESVDIFIAENKITNLDAIIAHFGEPEAIAGDFTATLDPSYIKKAMVWKKTVLIAVSAAVLIFAVYLVITLLDNHKDVIGYSVEEIVDNLLETNGG